MSSRKDWSQGSHRGKICYGEKPKIWRRMYIETVLETGETGNSG